ncbi:glycosyltransferase [Thalassotalea maritima]|uniref:glycosyltransferase n=1 Tax=Thalassotalea maritima TaxID=3242416 RepID=UPI003528AA0B
MRKKLLYVAYHYPPIIGSSGVHRTVSFVKHLAKSGWDVDVLTCKKLAYDKVDTKHSKQEPACANVIRCFAFNTQRHLSINGKYLSWLAQPDNWQSWILTGVLRASARLIRVKVDLIVSSYPITSAHIIAYILHRMFKVPWVADLRDPMLQDDYPQNKTKRKIFKWIESKIIKHCCFAVVTTEGAKRLYQSKYPEIPESFWNLIPNGFDEDLIESLNPHQPNQPKLTLLHSGLIYPSERDPCQLFAAISSMKHDGSISCSTFELRLRACGHEHIYRPILKKLDIEDVVKIGGLITFAEAIKEMQAASALLVIQAENCNYQIPAKVYEYIRIGKPILGLTPSKGDTGMLLSKIPQAILAPLDDTYMIKTAICELIDKVNTGAFTFLSEHEVKRYSRQSQALEFDKLLTEVVSIPEGKFS